MDGLVLQLSDLWDTSFTPFLWQQALRHNQSLVNFKHSFTLTFIQDRCFIAIVRYSQSPALRLWSKHVFIRNTEGYKYKHVCKIPMLTLERILIADDLQKTFLFLLNLQYDSWIFDTRSRNIIKATPKISWSAEFTFENTLRASNI